MAHSNSLYTGILAHWKLHGDAKDESGNGYHGFSQNVDFSVAGPSGEAYTGAKFSGRHSYIQLREGGSIPLGTSEFSIAAWVHTEDIHDNIFGNIASQYDPRVRKGFNLSIKNHAGMTSSQSNFRQLHFGIDNGATDGSWEDCGRPGNSVFIFAMAVHDGQLFVGTCEPGEGDAGHVYRYGGSGNWIDCGSPDRCNAVSSLAVYNGELYAGVSCYRLEGSSLPASPNQNPGGKVYRYAGDGEWIDCGQLGDSVALHGMAVYKGKLFVSSMYAPAGVFRYEGQQQWVDVGTPCGQRVEALGVYNGHLYGTGYDSGAVYRYEGAKQWSVVGNLPETSQTYALAVYRGHLYVSTWPHARVYRYDDHLRWVNCGRLGQEREAMGMAIYNGKLYAGSLPLAEVYRYEEDNSWTRLHRLDHTPGVTYRRAWTMAVYQGRLFCGTLPSGHVHAMEVGKNVTYDRELQAGWRHIVAVRKKERLELYVDGSMVASSATSSHSHYDISNDSPFYLGFGDHGYLNGALSDVRLYNRALTQEEISALSRLA
jgi:hypothetical protein